ncbi:hypothetical protein IL59_0214340 [Brucella suis bv. 4 str. 40]|nr:hypothetical protein IL59_0214340 [Brucella suis bv. 4 str. 40]
MVGSLHESMTLRDHFAASAPDVPNWFVFPGEPKEPEYDLTEFGQVYKSETEFDAYTVARRTWRIQRMAAWGFVYADAMLAAREVQP